MKMNMVRETYKYIEDLVRREVNYYRVTPTNLLLFLTYRCTSQCKSCTMWQRTSSEREMSLEEWRKFIDDVVTPAIRNVEMFGGDALLRRDVLVPLIDHCKRRGIPEVDLVTNGNLLDFGTAQALAATGIDRVYVSVDGVEETQDEVRGIPGSFRRAKTAVENLINARGSRPAPRIVLNCTVSRLNVHSFDRVMRWGTEMGADNVAFEYVGEFPCNSVQLSRIGTIVPEPYFVPQGRSILLNREEALLLKRKLKTLKDEWRAGGRRIYVNSSNIDVLRVEDMTSGTFPLKKCYVCRYLVTVDPYGNVLPCPFYNTYHLGNVRTQEFASIWDNPMHRAFLRSIDDSQPPMCRHCILSPQRNPSFMQSLLKGYLTFMRTGYDERKALRQHPGKTGGGDHEDENAA